MNPKTEDYDIWGKPGGAFRLGVLSVLMGRSGYLQHKKLTILPITGKITLTWLLSALQDLPHISDLEPADCLVSTTYNEKCELTTTTKKTRFQSVPWPSIMFPPKNLHLPSTRTHPFNQPIHLIRFPTRLSHL
jgi:hypothetical protein